MKVAILATIGVEQSELEKPRLALEQAGAETVLVSIDQSDFRAWDENKFGKTFSVDLLVSQANPDDFDALFLPGGVMNPDKLRNDPQAVEFARSFFSALKPVAAICHGPQLLISAQVLNGVKLTSYSSIKVDLINAGAIWVDEPVVVDGNLVTSRKPDDIPQFNAKMVELFARHALTLTNH